MYSSESLIQRILINQLIHKVIHQFILGIFIAFFYPQKSSVHCFNVWTVMQIIIAPPPLSLSLSLSLFLSLCVCVYSGNSILILI